MAGLNDMQQQACEHVDGPLLILAGAGSGKTRVITHRVAYLIDQEGVNPLNILAITFTNKAAQEMRERVNLIVGDGADRVWVSTFHSLCVRILRRYADRLGYGKSFDIYDADDQKSLVKSILKDLQIDPKRYPEKMFMSEISKAKEKYMSCDEFARKNATDFAATKVADVYTEYQNRLRKNNAMDFDDLIYKTVELFEHNPDVLDSYQNRFRYIMVDEYQDTNHIQFLMVKMLARKYKNLCVVGDDDQSIYKFRGANITNILGFEKEYPEAEVIKLEQNYRSCGNILAAANAVIQHNEGRKDKALWTDRDAGEKISFEQCDTEYVEGDMVASRIKSLVRQGVPYRDIAILYRTNAQSRILGEKMVYNNIPYRIYGGTNFYARKEIKDVLAYLKVVNNSTDNLYFRRVVNVPKRGIGEASLGKLESYANAYGISMLEAAERAKEIPGMAARTAGKIIQFAELIASFKSMIEEQESLDTIYDRILDETGYESELIAEHTEEAMTRLENIDELRNKIVEFAEDREDTGLSEFLEEIALVSDLDSLSENDDQVKLMTLHSAKGLEFPYVFICGMEERVFPSGMALNSDDPDAIEEERRLCYVGITRAMKKLYLSAAKERMMHGNRVYSDVSRFIREIPPLLFEHEADMINMARRRQQESVDRYNRGLDGGSGCLDASYSGTSSGGIRNYGRSNPYNAYKAKQPASQPAFGKAFVVAGSVKPDYSVGDRVRHIKFGSGTVEQLEKGDKDYEVTVNFDRCGIRKMYASFAKLKKE
jgi:DNA helicase-2/ATP-dependent DNA helicase PcrA